MMGKLNKKISLGETKNLINARRSIYAKREIKKNENFNFSNLKIVRPGNGMKQNKIPFVLNKKNKKNLKENNLIKKKNIN